MSSTSITAALHHLDHGHKPRFVLVSDLDHTMVEHGEPSHARLLSFNRLWSTCFAADSVLIFSTGRSPTLFCELWDEAPLLNPNVLICSVGTEIFYRTASGALAPDTAWEAALDKGWDRARVEGVAAGIPQLKKQVASEQRRHKLSYHLTRASPEQDAAVLQALRDGLAAQGLAAKVIYSGGIDVDILAEGAGKGKALEFILGELRQAGLYPSDGVQVNGDSGNDVELFEVPGVRGCVVANAHPELRQYAEAAVDAGSDHIAIATQPCAGGIVEVLRRFGSVPDGSPGAAARGAVCDMALLQAGASRADMYFGLAGPGATHVTPEGRLLALSGAAEQQQQQQQQQQQPPGGAPALAWADTICVRPLPPAGGSQQQQQGQDGHAGGQPLLLLATYQVWGMWGHPSERRDSGRARLCSAVLQTDAPGEAGSWRLLHLHESLMDEAATPTAAFRALAAAGGDVGA